MNITRENTGELTSTVKISITPEDYDEKVTKLLRDYQRKANIPGFRPGHVPFGMVKKMYGKAIMAEEINKIISESIADYIEKEKMAVLGNPLPNREKNSSIDFENPSSFDFYFDLGFAPEIPLDLGSLETERFEISIDDSMIDRYVDSVRQRHGTPVAEEHAEEAEDAVIVEDSENQTGSPENTESETKPLPKTEPAEMNQEFFDKVYPGMNIETEEDFREQIRKEAAASFAGEADNLFFRQVSDKLVKETSFPLPDDFLKHWLFESNEGKYSMKEIEDQYEEFAGSMRWQLIENKILKDHEIAVKDEDIRNYIKGYFLKNIPMMQEDPEMDKRYDSLVDTVMQNKEQVRKINDEIYTARLMELFKSTLKIENKEISYEEFIKLASTLHGHGRAHGGHDHDHDHEHDHEHDHNHEHDHEHEHPHKH